MEPKYGYAQVPSEQTDMFSRKMLLVGICIVVAIIIAIVLLLGSGQNNISTQAQHLSARLDNLQTMLSDTNTTRNIKNQDLSNLITGFSLSLTTDTNDINSLLGSQLPKKIDDKIIATESDVATQKNIEDAYLGNKLDKVYTDVLSKKIDSLRALVAEIYNLSKDQKLKTKLTQFDDHLRTTKQQLENLKL